MALLELKKDPSPRELAWFGLLLLLFAGIVGTLIWWSTGSLTVPRYVWGGGVGLAAVYYAVPPLRSRVFMAWMYASYPIGWAISHLLLAAIYFVLITLIGLVMRLVGYDPLARRFDSAAGTYWIRRESADDLQRYFRQY